MEYDLQPILDFAHDEVRKIVEAPFSLRRRMSERLLPSRFNRLFFLPQDMNKARQITAFLLEQTDLHPHEALAVELSATPPVIEQQNTELLQKTHAYETLKQATPEIQEQIQDTRTKADRMNKRSRMIVNHAIVTQAQNLVHAFKITQAQAIDWIEAQHAAGVALGTLLARRERPTLDELDEILKPVRETRPGLMEKQFEILNKAAQIMRPQVSTVTRRGLNHL